MDTPTNSREIAVTMAKANLYALVFALIPVGMILLFWALFGKEAIRVGNDFFNLWVFLPVAVIGIIVHELIHGFSWMAAARLPFSTMKFGFQMKTFTPYAHCTVPITKRSYVFGTLMPAITLGFAPFLWAIFTGNGWWLFFAVFFTFAAGGDFLIVWLLRKVPGHLLVADHPVKAGCYVYDGQPS
ncbi:MAG: DUF3267 domain-containing protein [Phycisphaerae bacterium]|nr:DUF3267 domain-containing protein [Saprospiraceae bacterium]